LCRRERFFVQTVDIVLICGAQSAFRAPNWVNSCWTAVWLGNGEFIRAARANMLWSLIAKGRDSIWRIICRNLHFGVNAIISGAANEVSLAAAATTCSL
jgi:hypothetical protein